MPACDNITDSKIQFQLKGPFLVSQAFSLIIIKHETYIEFDSPSLQGNIYICTSISVIHKNIKKLQAPPLLNTHIYRYTGNKKGV